ncbi:class I SAM-dependent methyltransferase [Mycobacterium simiae]|uniref:Class I SAM-dependent methyltransferase n=1 Tax=Mycobacterium simiae TaxID=1784 RepID=A0A5B1BL70_MYCSI|nr:class I SAM-dependent methyltransferase [Mycobacterium simiae]KAA1249437.1 class I SAM-dependent methyltransferase [Mycobacterium simiae]
MSRTAEPPAAVKRSFAGPDRWDLDDHERALLEPFADRWTQLRVLDLGVGTGRTWFAFGWRAGRYVGVELIPELARRAVERTQGRATVLVADAAQLPLPDSGFDLVCFSFNGLDYADPRTRARILQEAARVLRPGGYLYFTTHSLEWLLARSVPDRRGELSEIERQRLAQLRADRSAGMVVLHDDVGNGTCYVTHDWELGELRALGFLVTDVHDNNSSSRAYLAQTPGLP